ncbi:ribonuclease BN (tRNA processing enzyme) [Klebsiella sp. BIGb0407]|nr:ribonuclease BN (tRNA processing enzyme) [Klebsiella sp. BIGb0407]
MLRLCIEQHDKPGTLDASQLIADGVPPGPLFQRLKQGLTIELEDGRVIDGSRYLGRPLRARTLIQPANGEAGWMRMSVP